MTKTADRAGNIRRRLEYILAKCKGHNLYSKIENADVDETWREMFHTIREWCNDHIHGSNTGNENALANNFEEFLHGMHQVQGK